MKEFILINPATEEKFATVALISDEILREKIDLADKVQKDWRYSDHNTRRALTGKLASLLETRKEQLAQLMTKEMGKPISQSYAEIDKCIWLCRYYADNFSEFLNNEPVETDASKSFIKYEPLGICYAIMPWNFPLWQVMRFAVPAVLAGNGALLKHAPNVSLTAIEIEKLFIDTGFKEGVFQSLIISNDQSEKVLSDFRVKSVNVTASEQTGSIVASIAGREIKKSVLELGGSDPFIVLEDADIESAAKTAVASRLINSGQTCISAKRFIVDQKVYSDFIDLFVTEFKSYKMGNPTETTTRIGPLARIDILEQIEHQTKNTITSNAKLLLGGKRADRKGFFFEPTVFADVSPNIEISCNETFGPLAAILPSTDINNSLLIANSTRFGLGASVYTNDMDKADYLINRLNAGHVSINGMVKSDPRLPFGGTNRSGYGRELSCLGLREFCNPKTIWIA